MEPEFIREPNFDVIGIGREFLFPPIAYLTLDRKLLKIQWHPGKITYHLPETYQSVRFETLAAAFYAAYGKEMS
ncbi:hypothetical protein LJR016_000181 [Devosia sp. LjRoot16]|uniref:hypothetical protein n=1 Tax=Devosia sp. LjRoot16 TaxID=3342271 RepID=UPI003ECE6730